MIKKKSQIFIHYLCLMNEKKSYTFEEIKQKLVNYCVYQDRCHYEVEQKMRDFLLIPEAKEEILLYLMQENYLNEERFVRSYIHGKFYIKNWGKNKIKINLKAKDIPEKLINKCFDEIDADDYEKVIKNLGEKYFATLKGLQLYQKKIKTTRHLIAKGFEYEIVKEIIDDFQ